MDWHFVVELVPSEAVTSLRRKVAELQSVHQADSERIRQLEQKYAYEVQFNNFLCDLLKEHGISFRDYLSHEWRKEKGY